MHEIFSEEHHLDKAEWEGGASIRGEIDTH